MFDFQWRALILFILMLMMSGVDAATWTVTSTLDDPWTGDFNAPKSTAPGHPVTLRSAIEFLNGPSAFTPGDTIAFSIPGPAPYIIQPGGASSPSPGVELPTITQPVIIDGYVGSPGGATPNSDPLVSNAVLTVVINGSNYTVGDGVTFGEGLYFDIGSAGSLLRGLVFNEWIFAGLTLVDNEISVVGCFIGTDAAGSLQRANACGILGIGGNLTIGTNAANSFDVADRNLINGGFGFINLSSGAGVNLYASGTAINGNLIGLDKTGTKALGNMQVGVFGIDDTLIGGTTPAERNVISGQSIAGIFVLGTGSLVQGNYVGTNAIGTEALSNLEGIGIAFFGPTTFNTIGGTVPEAANVVSGWNAGFSVGLNMTAPGSNYNTIQGNLIGTNFDGTKKLPNRDGILVNDFDNFIGVNVISGNLQTGITIFGSGVSGNLVQGNRIGIDTRDDPLGNGYAGVLIGLAGGFGGSSNNLIGGNAPGEGNFIGANGKYGVAVEAYSSGNVIQGNSFGKGKLANGKKNIHFSHSKENIVIGN